VGSRQTFSTDKSMICTKWLEIFLSAYDQTCCALVKHLIVNVSILLQVKLLPRFFSSMSLGLSILRYKILDIYFPSMWNSNSITFAFKYLWEMMVCDYWNYYLSPWRVSGALDKTLRVNTFVILKNRVMRTILLVYSLEIVIYETRKNDFL
jgi:hypothetical protein